MDADAADPARQALAVHVGATALPGIEQFVGDGVVGDAQAGLALDANPADQSILVGLPGEDYVSVLDELGRPPNTSMY